MAAVGRDKVLEVDAASSATTRVMIDSYDIAEVARRTGLTSRALRFYEARGLVRPLRSASGRRYYGAGELDRISQILALKKAGLTLAQIQQLGDRRPLDLARLIDAQLEAVEARAAELAEAKALLLTVKSCIDRGEPIDVATFCSLIRNGDTIMESDGWKNVIDRYFTPEEQVEWAERMAQVPDGFDQEAYGLKWKELSARIEAAMPMEPMSAEAQAFVDEWFALLKPFTQVATPAMRNGTVRMYDDMESWGGQADPGFSKVIWDFVKLATAARLAAGGSVGGPVR